MSANPLADLLGDAVEETKSQKYPSAANEALPRAAAKPLESIALEFDSISADVGVAPVAGSDAPLGGLQLFGGGAAKGGGGAARPAPAPAAPPAEDVDEFADEVTTIEIGSAAAGGHDDEFDEFDDAFGASDPAVAPAAAAVGARRLGVQGAVEPSLHRKSGARLLWPEEGAEGWVAHRENGIVYGLDVTRNMFSSGNGTEKARVAARNCDGEVVVDLYAGIGYFTLPYLVHAKEAHVHACEWDADALAALRHNLHANGVAARCTVHAGDNARSAPAFAGTADRVNLGLIPSSEAGWPTAVAALRARGGWLHVHANVGDGDEARWSTALLDALRALAAAAGREWRLDVEHVERVKWYAPRVRHVVADVRAVAVAGAAAAVAPV